MKKEIPQGVVWAIIGVAVVGIVVFGVTQFSAGPTLSSDQQKVADMQVQVQQDMSSQRAGQPSGSTPTGGEAAAREAMGSSY